MTYLEAIRSHLSIFGRAFVVVVWKKAGLQTCGDRRMVTVFTPSSERVVKHVCVALDD